MKLKLVYLGDSLLRKQCIEVDNITDEIKQLANDIIETMDVNNGVGLAAIQIGVLKRIFVIREVLENENGDSYLAEPEVFINPKITNPSQKTEIMPEGCLSVPGIHMEVERPCKIHVEYLDINGKRISKDIEGFKAREIMHENDHLNGTLFIDRLKEDQKKEIDHLLKEIIKKYN
ncbi:MAG: Peptide deformylase [Candidatus Anoxychlamydiales bacterium]|nr:Peptide deformylase [Candidatus Anoxychlamydiales bacterium]